VRVANRSGNSVESKARRLGRELHLGANMEESEVAVDKVVSYTSCLILFEQARSVHDVGNRQPLMDTNHNDMTYVDIDLAAQHILRFLESVVCGQRGAGFDFVET
jgi:hypothetical protein